MDISVYIVLKSDKEILINDFQYITYPSNGDSSSTKVENFENFYLYDRLLTFVGKSDIISLSSTDIEFIKFSGSFTE